MGGVVPRPLDDAAAAAVTVGDATIVASTDVGVTVGNATRTGVCVGTSGVGVNEGVGVIGRVKDSHATRKISASAARIQGRKFVEPNIDKNNYSAKSTMSQFCNEPIYQ